MDSNKTGTQKVQNTTGSAATAASLTTNFVARSADAAGGSDKNLYRLGQTIFALNNCDPLYERDLDRLLPRSPAADSCVEAPQIVETGCSKNISDLLAHIAKMSRERLWLQASCLVNETGRKILIAGQSGSGKSTLALGLALRNSWRFVSEGYLTLDLHSNLLAPFLAPISLDDRSIAELRALDLTLPGSFFSPEWRKSRMWSPICEWSELTEHEANFDVAIILGKSDQPDLRVSQISPEEFVCKSLSISNALRLQGSSERLLSALTSATCLSLLGGGLLERIEILSKYADSSRI